MAFEFRLESRYPVAVATLSGALDAAEAARVVAALRSCLVDDQPVEMIIDVTGLTEAPPEVLPPVLELVECAGRWPGTRVAFGGGGPELATAITAASVGAVEVFPGVPQAVAAGAGQVPSQATADLLPTTDAPAACRELIARACQSWRITRLQSLAQLLGSELVSNAVVHARTKLQLMIRHAPPVLRLAVRDHDPRLVAPLPPSQGPDAPLADVGRGVLLLETLADDWGCVPTADGKVVWASVAAPVGAGVSRVAA